MNSLNFTNLEIFLLILCCAQAFAYVYTNFSVVKMELPTTNQDPASPGAIRRYVERIIDREQPKEPCIVDVTTSFIVTPVSSGGYSVELTDAGSKLRKE